MFFCLMSPAFADDCIEYKTNPKITVKEPEWKKTVVLSDEPMDEYHGKYISFKLHGVTQANFILKYEINVEFLPVKTGFCAVLKNIDATIGYDNFDIKIDKSHKENICAYNAVLAHEEKHVEAYLSVLRDLSSEINNSILNAGNAVMPVFIENYNDVDTVINMFDKSIKNHPDVVLVTQKLHAAEEIRNKRIDQEETGEDLNKCF
ncbi:MAG: hypothetical protein K5912_00560 [Alphaproteobacteria bacterium]|nr:hypothetical protein [Alphaproteobacteria bacterium]